MNPLMILQVSQNVLTKSADMVQKDPHGMIITIVSISVVFAALVLLFFAYTLIGKLASGQISLKKRTSEKTGKTPSEEEAAAIAMALDRELGGETYAAIAMALDMYLNDTVHDMESYVITIKRRK